MSDILEIEKVLYTILERSEHTGYRGYSKFDGLHSPLARVLCLGFWPLRLIWTQAITRAPVNLRPLFFVRKGVNPENPALFGRANLDMHTMKPGGPFKKRVEYCLRWLRENSSNRRGNYHGACWGYHHPWQSSGFYQRPGYPNCYVTVIAGGALLHGFRLLNVEDYLAVSRSAVDFILCDLQGYNSIIN